MSLLQQNSSAQDDAARGESFTKGTSHVVWASIVAAILVSAAIAWYFIAGEKPPVATGQIMSVTAYTRHQKTAAVDAAGQPMPQQEFDQVLVFTHLKVHNQSKDPLFLRHVMTSVTLDDGVHNSYAAIPGDYERIFIAYPELADLRGKPLPNEATLPPGQTVEGDVVSSFRMSRQQWDGRKGVSYSVGFQYQPDLNLTLAVPIATRP